MLQQIATGKQFDADAVHMTALNDYMATAQEQFSAFFRAGTRKRASIACLCVSLCLCGANLARRACMRVCVGTYSVMGRWLERTWIAYADRLAVFLFFVSLTLSRYMHAYASACVCACGAATEVPSAEDHYQIDPLDDVAQMQKPVVYISANELFTTHALLLEGLDDVVRSCAPHPVRLRARARACLCDSACDMYARAYAARLSLPPSLTDTHTHCLSLCRRAGRRTRICVSCWAPWACRQRQARTSRRTATNFPSPSPTSLSTLTVRAPIAARARTEADVHVH
jgi:hypothetical protein